MESKIKMKSIIVSMLAAAGLMVAGSAMAFDTAPCKACHAVGKDVVGPDWAVVAKDYGSADALAKVFKGGFKVEDRKVAGSNEKWKKQAAMMTNIYNTNIKGHEDDAAKALFDAVKAGKL